MPPAIPIIAAVAGAAVSTSLAAAGGFWLGAAAIGINAFGAAVIGAVVTAGVGMLGGALFGQTEDVESQTYSSEFDNDKGILLNKRSNNSPIPVVYGEREIGGNICYIETDGTNNEYLYLIVSLCEGEIDSVNSVYFDGYEIANGHLDGNGDVTTGRYSGQARIVKYVGTDSQTADPTFTSISSGNWTSAHRLRGVAYLAVRLQFDREIYSKIPTITADVKGKKVLNSTTSVTEWSSNPIWCVRDYLTNNRYGRGIDASIIDDGVGGTFRTEAITCDTNITTMGDLSNVVQYTCNGIVDPSQNDIDVVSKLLTSCRGMLVFSGGIYKIIIDKAISPTSFIFDESNIVGSWNISLGSKTNQFNRMKVNFFNPDRSWQSDIVIFDNSTYRTADNELLLEREIYLPFTDNRDRSLYIAEQNLRQSRQQISVEFTATIEGTRAEVGDVVPITHSTPAWSEKNFRVLGIRLKNDDEVIITAREYDATVYAVNTVVSGDATPNTNLPDPFTVATPTSLVMNETVLTLGLGVTNRATLTWTQSADAFIGLYIVEYKLSAGSDWTEHDDKPDGNRLDGASKVYSYIDGLTAGTYDFRVKAVNVSEISSTYITITSQAITGSDSAPNTVTGLSATSFNSAIKLSWTGNTEPDLDSYFVYRHTSNVFGSASVVSIVKGMVNASFVAYYDRPSSIDTTYYYWITAVDLAGNESTETTSVNGVINEIVEAEIADGAITAAKITVDNLAAIDINTGALTVDDSITVSATGAIFSDGKTSPTDTTPGFFLGYSGGEYQFAIGDNINSITWDGSTLIMDGTLGGARAGDLLESESTGVDNNASTTYTKIKSIRLGRTGVYRIKFDLSAILGATAKGQIYKNGSPFGTERTTTSGTPATYSEDLSFSSTDTCDLYTRVTVQTGLERAHNEFLEIYTSNPIFNLVLI